MEDRTTKLLCGFGVDFRTPTKSAPVAVSSKRETLGISGVGFLQAGCCSYHRAISVKALEETCETCLFGKINTAASTFSLLLWACLLLLPVLL